MDFNNTSPIYLQIVEYLQFSIISGKYQPGEKIPPVRELSTSMKVNPNTMQKALTELENLKLIYTERTNGKYVTEDKKIIAKYKENYIRKLTSEYLNNLTKLGLNIEDIKRLIGDKNGINKH